MLPMVHQMHRVDDEVMMQWPDSYTGRIVLGSFLAPLPFLSKYISIPAVAADRENLGMSARSKKLRAILTMSWHKSHAGSVSPRSLDGPAGSRPASTW